MDKPVVYIRNELLYKRLHDMDVNDLEVMWIKVMLNQCLVNCHVYILFNIYV